MVWVVPGSHKRDLKPSELIFITTHRHAPHPDQVITHIPVGHALLLNTYTLHRAQCSRHHLRRAIHFGFSRVGAKHEPGRKIKQWPWLRDQKFLATQTTFIRDAILEEVREAENMETSNGYI